MGVHTNQTKSLRKGDKRTKLHFISLTTFSSYLFTAELLHKKVSCAKQKT